MGIEVVVEEDVSADTEVRNNIMFPTKDALNGLKTDIHLVLLNR